MHQLYDLGYLSLSSNSTLKEVATSLDAIVIDARFSPRSRNPAWNRNALQTLLGDRYTHVDHLGNLNHRVQNAAIVIKDFPAGAAAIIWHLALHPVILMCACWNRDLCHRKVIVDLLECDFQITSIPLDKAACADLIKRQDPQLPLFKV